MDTTAKTKQPSDGASLQQEVEQLGDVAQEKPSSDYVDDGPELGGRATSLDYPRRKVKQTPHVRSPGAGSYSQRPPRLVRLHSFSVSDVGQRKVEKPIYSLSRPFPQAEGRPILRRRSRSVFEGDYSVPVTIHPPPVINCPSLSGARAFEPTPSLLGLPVRQPGELMTLDTLPQGQYIVATPELLRNLLYESQRRPMDPTERTRSSMNCRRSTGLEATQEVPNEEEIPVCVPELGSSTAFAPEKVQSCSKSMRSMESHPDPRYAIYDDAYCGPHDTIFHMENPTEPSCYMRFKSMIREPAAEAIGTCLMTILSSGASAQSFLTANTTISPTPKGNFVTQVFGTGAGVMVGIYVAGGVSGGHLNPIVTIALAVFRGFSWTKVVPYILGQTLGAAVAYGILQIAFAEALDVFEGGQGVRTLTGPTSTARFFLPATADFMSNANSFFQEFLDSTILLIVIMAVGDRHNTPPPDGVSPIVYMWLIVALNFGLGSQTLPSMNPGQDIAARVIACVSGYGTGNWTYRDHFWLWNSWLSNTSGALFGCLVYDAFIYLGKDSPVNGSWNWSFGKRLFKRFKGRRRRASNDPKMNVDNRV